MPTIDDLRAGFTARLDHRDVFIEALCADDDTSYDHPAIRLKKGSDNIVLTVEDWERAIVLIKAIHETITLATARAKAQRDDRRHS